MSANREELPAPPAPPPAPERRQRQTHDLRRSNWLHGRCSSISFPGHGKFVVTCLQFDDDKIVSGSDDKTILIHDTRTGQLIRRLTGHTGGVWTMQYHENTLASGSTDGTNMETGQCTHVLEAAAASSKSTPTNESPHLLHVLTGHTQTIRSIAGHGGVVVSGGYDSTVRVWNLVTGQMDHCLTGHRDRVYSVAYCHETRRAASGSLDTNVRVWDTMLGTALFVLEAARGNSSRQGGNGGFAPNDRAVGGDAGGGHNAGPADGALQAPPPPIPQDDAETTAAPTTTLPPPPRHGRFVRDITSAFSVWRVKMDRRRLVTALQGRGAQTWFEVRDFGGVGGDGEDDGDEGEYNHDFSDGHGGAGGGGGVVMMAKGTKYH
ncbi:WD40-repeat-containing domain protein [Zopfochytrium polystomum]|nr:WD40-repeat-containing domain protein [Zopfochytrium polystomum]